MSLSDTVLCNINFKEINVCKESEDFKFEKQKLHPKRKRKRSRMKKPQECSSMPTFLYEPDQGYSSLIAEGGHHLRYMC